MDPLQLTYIRFVVGGLLLMPLAVAHLKKHRIRLTAKDHLLLAVVGVIGVTISMSLFQVAVMMCNASTISVMFCVNPFFTMVFAHLFANEDFSRNKIMVLAFALTGIFFMMRPWDVQAGNSARGMILIILAALVFGLYTIVGKVIQKKIGFVAQTSISFLYGAAVLMIILMILGRPVIAGLSANIPVIIYTGVVVTGLGYYCYFKAIELSDASTGSIAFFLKPAIAPVIAVIVLRETILWNTVVGILLILTASLMNLVPANKWKELLHRK